MKNDIGMCDRHIKDLDLEGVAWVGHGVANFQDLLQTGRKFAPLIIFMDDFDLLLFFVGKNWTPKCNTTKLL